LVPVGFGFGLWAAAPKRAERLSRLAGKRRDWLANALDGMGVLQKLIRNPRVYWGAWLGTALYWAADIGAFYGGLRTFGLDPSVGKVILAYATGYAATRRSLPLGGAGVTEVLMTYSLYWVREPLAPALAAVVAYRAFNFLLAAAPALIAQRQLEPLLVAAEKRRPKRSLSKLEAETTVRDLRPGSPTTSSPADNTSSFNESQILALAKSVAARAGDPTPCLIQHSIGTREQANRVMTGGAHLVPGEEECYLIAIQGHFSGPVSLPPLAPRSVQRTTIWSVQMLVINAATGQVTDAGGSDEYPDLAALGPVITDYSTPEPDEGQSHAGSASR
jgi:hypothetical protein